MSALTKEEHKKTICVLQVTRIGDVLQTIRALLSFKNENPDIRLIFVGRKRFCKQIEIYLKSVFDEIFLFEVDEFFDLKNPNLDDCKKRIQNFINEVNHLPIDALVNLSFSKSSEYLAKLIPATNRIGFFRDEKSNLVIKDKWSQYVFSNIMANNLNTFNLVDVFRNMVGLKIPFFSTRLPEAKGNNIIVHPFASSKRKAWAEYKWSELLIHICKNHPLAKVVIIGSNNDIGECEKILSHPELEKHTEQIVSLVGEKKIFELSEYYEDATLFIGHDSMGGHLASLHNIQTLTIGLGTTRAHETIPYGNLNYYLTPNMDCFPCTPRQSCETFECHKEISISTVSGCVDQLIHKGMIDFEKVEKNLNDEQKSRFNLWTSHIDENVGLRLSQINPFSTNLRNSFLKFYDILWNYQLLGFEIEGSFPKLSEVQYRTLLSLKQGLNSLFELGEFSQTYSGYLIRESSAETTNLNNIKEFFEKLNEIDEMLLTLKKSFPIFAPLIDSFFVSKNNLVTSGLKAQAEEIYVIGQEFCNQLKVVFDLVEMTIQNYQTNNKNMSFEHKNSESLNN